VDATAALGRPLDAEEVYQTFSSAVLAYVRAHVADDPENIAAEVFFEVVRDLPRFRGDDGALRRWVFTIAHHRVVDHHRRRRRRSGELPEAARPHDGDMVDGAAVIDPALVNALQRLTHDQREVVVLRFVADLPIADVARLLRRRQGAVKALQHRALANLSAALGSGDGPRSTT
jgi:RNA polymerase sigma-70 factor (ECF subfamily)